MQIRLQRPKEVIAVKKARIASEWLKAYVRGKWDAVTIGYDYILKG